MIHNSSTPIHTDARNARHGDGQARSCECGYALSGLPLDESGKCRCPECGVQSFGQQQRATASASTLLIIAAVAPCACLLMSTLLRNQGGFGFLHNSWVEVAIIDTGLAMQCVAWFIWFGNARMNIIARAIMSVVSAFATTMAGYVFVFIVLAARMVLSL